MRSPRAAYRAAPGASVFRRQRRTGPKKKGAAAVGAGRRLGRVTPTHRMPDESTTHRRATLAEVSNALCVARCSAQLAGMETREFVVRELLLTVLQQIDRAAAAARRLS